MSKFAPVLFRLEIECWILGIEMSSYRVYKGNHPEIIMQNRFCPG